MPYRVNPNVARPDPQQIATGNLGGPSAVSNIGEVRPRQVDNTKWGPDVIGGLLGFAESISKQAWVDQTERTYAEAARARMLGESMDSVQGNALLKPFIRGGFQDMDFQLKQAEMQNEALAYINGDGKALTPDKFQEYLAEKSKGMWAEVGDGLSRKQRSVSLQTQMQAEQGLMAAHSKAHQEYLLEQRYQQLTALVSADLRGLQELQGHDTMPALGKLNSSMQRLMQELPRDMHEPMIEKIMLTLYKDGMINEADVLFNGGEDGLGTLPGIPVEVRYKIADAQRAAKEKLATKTNVETAQVMAAASLAHREGKVFSLQEVTELVRQYPALLNAYTNKDIAALMLPRAADQTADKKLQKFRAMATMDRRAVEAEFGGVTDSDMDGFYAQTKMELDGDTAAAIQHSLRVSEALGLFSPQLAKDFADSLSTVLNNPDLDTTDYHWQVVQALTEHVQAKYSVGEGQLTLGQLEQKMPAELQGVLSSLAMDQAAGSLQQRIERAQQRVTAANAIYAQNQVLHTKNVQSVTSRIEEVLTGDLSGTLMRSFKSITGLGDQQIKRGGTSFNRMANALYEEVEFLMASNPALANLYSDDPDLAAAHALESLKHRTITLSSKDWVLDTDSSRALVLPRDGSGTKVPFLDKIYEASGIPSGHISQKWVEESILEQVKPPKGFSLEFSVDGQQIIPVYIDRSSNSAVPGRPLDPIKAGESIRKRRDELLQKQSDQTFGKEVELGATGENVKLLKPYDPVSRGRVRLLIDGNNEAGLPESDVLRWREELVRSEGARRSLYGDDTKQGGKVIITRKAFGVGHNYRPELAEFYETLKDSDGKLTNEGMSRLFAQDTNDAIRVGVRLAEQYGIARPEAQLAIAEMVFQLGREGAYKFEQTFKQIAEARDYDELVRRSRTWPWYKQTPDRVEKFLAAVKPLF